MEKLFIPALRGVFGDWVYYSCLMPTTTVAKRISFADELHKNKKLSELIQRQIKATRGVEIANYLRTQKERFFNSLVVAVYGGEPVWHEFDIQSKNKDISIEDIPDYALHSFGFLSFSNSEKLFALDGQHRLAGLKNVANKGISDDISIILVGHKNTKTGLQRTRRLFTTLNKTPVPVSKGERIALDENDLMAIIVRRLVEENPFFGGERVAYSANNNLAKNDFKSLITIGALYDVLSVFFTKILKVDQLKKLQYSRPPDNELNSYYDDACKLFQELQKNIPELKDYFKATDYSSIVKTNRGLSGGSIIFRPLGFIILMEVIATLSVKYDLNKSIAMASKIPRELSKTPFANVLWDVKAKTIVPKRKVLAKNLMLHMLGEFKKPEDLLKSYAIALGKDIEDTKLPSKIN